MNNFSKIALVCLLALLCLGNAWMYYKKNNTTAQTSQTTISSTNNSENLTSKGTLIPQAQENTSPPNETNNLPTTSDKENDSVVFETPKAEEAPATPAPPPAKETAQTTKPTVENLEDVFIQHQLVNIKHIDPSILVDLRYATDNNFMGENVYGDISAAYLQREVALKLSKAQEFLKEMKPDLSLMILDGARPHQVQQKMWDLVKGTDAHKYVAAPSHGSIHNYGAAIDLTIATVDGQELDMGTDFDHFGELAQPRHERKFTQMGELTSSQLANRVLLRQVMKKAGFRNIQSEWWHFESCNIHTARKKYKIIK